MKTSFMLGSDLNYYLLRFCSDETLKPLVLVNKEFSSLSVSEVKERASKKLLVYGKNLTELPKYYPKGHLCKGEEIDYSKIEQLDCSWNDLISLPGGPTGLQNCRKLICYDNQLTSLPDCLGTCEVLWCDNNQLTSLPDCLGNCRELFCDNNRLTSFPDGPRGLKNCRELHCNNNFLTSLPESLRNCKKLYCFNNNLTSIPDCLKNCKIRGFIT